MLDKRPMRVADNVVRGDWLGCADSFVRDRHGVESIGHAIVDGVVLDEQNLAVTD